VKKVEMTQNIAHHHLNIELVKDLILDKLTKFADENPEFEPTSKMVVNIATEVTGRFSALGDAIQPTNKAGTF
jgi:hypothetical protein